MQAPINFTVTPEGVRISYLNVSVCVPQGAFPRKSTLEIAACLSVGPSQCPQGIIPISAVFKIHPTTKLVLRKPIVVTLPHLLSDTTKLSEGLKLGVLKATRNKAGHYVFEKLDTRVELLGDKVRFTLEHFCYLKLYAEVKPEETLEFKYCICPVIPDFSKISFDGPARLYYCLTYFDHIFLKVSSYTQCMLYMPVTTSCVLQALEDQCEKVPRLAGLGYHIDYDMMKEFSAPHSLTVDDLSPISSRPKSSGSWEWETLHKVIQIEFIVNCSILSR